MVLLVASHLQCCAHGVPSSLRDVYKAALGLGTANQLTNILRDVGEDATERNRIYVPTEELAQFGISESEVGKAAGHMTHPGSCLCLIACMASGAMTRLSVECPTLML